MVVGSISIVSMGAARLGEELREPVVGGGFMKLYPKWFSPSIHLILDMECNWPGFMLILR